jgi:DNA repair protein RecO (recombination protein O)
MALVRLEAVVLKLHALGDTSRIAVFYTRERGLVRAVAKGARQPKSRFAGALEPLTRVDLVVYFKEGRELQLLSAADPIESYVAGGTDLERLAHAQAAAEFVDRLVWGEEEEGAFYDLLTAALGQLARCPDAALPAVTIAFQVQAAGLLGYRPALDVCAGCGADPGASRHFAPARGGRVCARCAAQDAMGVTLSAEGLADLRRLAAADLGGETPAPAARAGELLKLMEVYLQNHFQRFSGFRSLELLRGLEAARGGKAR